MRNLSASELDKARAILAEIGVSARRDDAAARILLGYLGGMLHFLLLGNPDDDVRAAAALYVAWHLPPAVEAPRDISGLPACTEPTDDQLRRVLAHLREMR